MTAAAPPLRRLLVTGAAGRVGTALRAGLPDLASRVRVTDVEPLEATGGTDHNLRGSAHVFEAARRAGTRRVVFASSNHATGFYPAGEAIAPDVPHRPDGFYGLAKCAVEDLGRLYHDKFGLEVVCVRIGTFAPRPRNARELVTWLSARDAVTLFRCCLLAERVGFAVVYGLSGNRRRVWPLPAELGYVPADDAERYAAEVDSSPGAGAGHQGGPFTLPEATRFA